VCYRLLTGLTTGFWVSQPGESGSYVRPDIFGQVSKAAIALRPLAPPANEAYPRLVVSGIRDPDLFPFVGKLTGLTCQW